MLAAVLLLYTISYVSSLSTDMEFATDFLVRYGYLKADQQSNVDSVSDISLPLMTFQENYNLTVDGLLNVETLNKMKSRWCGNEDFVAYNAFTRWNKTQLTWRFALATPDMLAAANQAFAIWEKHSNLKFTYKPRNADIVIGMKYLKHRCIVNKTAYCPYDLDGQGAVLAHAYYPHPGRQVTEIHMDYYENWYYGNKSDVPHDHTGFLQVLTHEIGHTLGLAHSFETDSVMYAHYREPLNVGDEFDLTTDDIMGIQHLYSKPITTTDTSTPTTSATTTPVTSATSTPITTSTSSSTTPTNIDLCKVKNGNHMFLVSGKNIYIVNDNLM